MAIYKKRGHSFTKNFIVLNKKRNKDKILFGFQVSIGINADEPQYYNTTANWIFIGGGFQLNPAEMIPGLNLRWNVKHYDLKGRLIK